jgi:hypothetical protein
MAGHYLLNAMFLLTIDFRLEPFLYHVLAFRKDRLDPGPTKPIPMEPILKAISAKPPHFFASHVRHLAVNNNVPRALVDYILSVCTGIDNLALFNGDSTPSLMPLVDRIRPRRFSVNMRGLFGGAPDFTHPMFSKTTHLDVSDTFGDEWVAWNRLASLAHLTHLSFNYSDEALPGGLFHELLRDCKLLQALIIVWPSLLRFEYEAEVGEYPTQDPRFVMIVCGSYFADWLDGARGGEDFWARADNFIARKRRGEVAGTSGVH